MNTQCHASIKAMPFEVVFGIKPSSEPVSDLTVINERCGDSKILDDSEDDSGNERNENEDFEDGCFNGDDYGGHDNDVDNYNTGVELDGNDDDDDDEKGADDRLDNNDDVELNKNDDDEEQKDDYIVNKLDNNANVECNEDAELNGNDDDDEYGSDDDDDVVKIKNDNGSDPNDVPG